MTKTAPEMLERATKLAGAACAATGRTDYTPDDLSLSMSIEVTHEGHAVAWYAYLGDISTGASSKTLDGALNRLEEHIDSMQGGGG